MKLEEFESMWSRHGYSETCKNCGKESRVYTQEDRNPEYYTAVYIECTCGEYLKFELPVN